MRREKMKPRLKPVFVGIFVLLLMTQMGCRRVKGDTMVIVYFGSSTVRGQVTFQLNPGTGKMEPDLWQPGILYFFRVGREVNLYNRGDPGIIYRVNKKRMLKKVGEFDESKSDEELVKQYLRASKDNTD
jgi:hypothetical protein